MTCSVELTQLQTGEVLTIFKDGVTYEHYVEGLLFRKKHHPSKVNAPERVVYLPLVGDELEVIKTAIVTKSDSHAYSHALMRRTIDDRWVYYPVPLVFTDSHSRTEAAKRSRTKVPNNRWIRRARYKIATFLKLEHHWSLPPADIAGD